MLYTLSQIVIIISTIIYSISLLKKSKKNMLIIQIISSLFFIGHYFLLVELLAGFVCIIEWIRLITFYVLEKYENLNTQKNRIILGVIFSIVCGISAIFTWSGIYCILPLIATTVINITLSVDNVLFYKIGAIIYTILTIIFMFLIGSTFGAISQLVVLIFGIIGLVIYLNSLKNEKIV